ncbi:hypothetical protein PSTG_02275 [Puccinia striiformis f. sp. tritici PST-78]|uniref:BED-type domain-containing protein n=1 Tax=Puccinia striiformis f. sp. tritici PST-78 TaxID=1165861 RepID=A0A0L0VZC0_9BASI|nr:hypothetical protein PSTG_02275 [Puccinia striiformis f. sp. tritici PST-78]
MGRDDSSAPSRSNSRKKKTCTVGHVDDDSEDKTIASNINPKLSDEAELKNAIRVHKNQQSQSYAYYDLPILSEKTDKHGRKMSAYPCKTCGQDINWPTDETSPTNLNKHILNCHQRERDSQGTQKLADVGISGTGDIDPREVPQLCAIWCAQAARPFAALGDPSHQGIIHPVVLKNLPSQRTVSNGIAKLYTAVQESLIASLKKHQGAMYLA